MSDLIAEGFVNEERFAKSYAGGKFRLKKWGRLKIERELRNHGLTDYCIRVGLKEIEEEDYLQTVQELIEKKSTSINEEDPFIRKAKITRFLVGRGFEYDVINSFLD